MRVIPLALSAALLMSFSVLAAEQVSQKEIDHFKLNYIGNITISTTNESITSPFDLREKLSEMADKKGGKYYHIIAARENGANFDAIAEVYK